MTRLHEQFDGDRVERIPVTEYRSMMNRFEIPCSVCGRPLFVDQDTKREIQRSLDRDLENTLTCAECERNLDESAFE